MKRRGLRYIYFVSRIVLLRLELLLLYYLLLVRQFKNYSFFSVIYEVSCVNLLQGITVEVGRAQFETETTRFTILDAPVNCRLLCDIYTCVILFCLFAMKAPVEDTHEVGSI